MRTINKQTVLPLICVVSIAFSSGCTNWKKKYQAMDVAYRNCEGERAYLKGERTDLEKELSAGQRTIAQLQREIEERGKVPGFEDYEFALDPTAGTLTVLLPNTILFNSGEAALKKATNTDLNHIESVLESRHPGRQIDVVGHTDSDPIKATKDKWKDNLELSSQRALSVTRYLIKRGIPKDKIRAVGCGAARPIDSNATPSGKARNRRVEIVVYMR
jgi:chemotaxis protein MotB